MTTTGTTLFEAVVSVFILGMVAVSALGVAAQQAEGERALAVRVRASHLAEDRLEALRGLPSEDLHRLAGDTVSGVFDPPFDRFEWTATVRELDATYGLIGVDMAVSRDNVRVPLSATLYRPAR